MITLLFDFLSCLTPALPFHKFTFTGTRSVSMPPQEDYENEKCRQKSRPFLTVEHSSPVGRRSGDVEHKHRQQHEGPYPVPPGEKRNLRVSPFRQWTRTSLAVSSTLHRDPRQLGSCGD